MNPQNAAQVVSTLPESTYQSVTYWVALILVFFAAYIFLRAFFQEEQTHSAKQLLGDDEKSRKQASDVIIKYSRPFFTRYVVPVVADMKLEAQRKAAKRKLIISGLIDELTPDEFLSMKIFLIIGAPATIYIFSKLADIEIWWGWILLSSPLGYVYPDIMVRDRAALRQKQAKRQMPFIIDLLALSTEAGLDFMGAIGKVVAKAKPGPLVDELSQVLKEIKVGSSRQEALKDMASRLDFQEINSFVSILVSADEMGASIGKVLRQQSEQLRMERMLAAEKEGAKAATKIFGPMMALILPAVMLMIFVPVALQFMSTGGL